MRRVASRALAAAARTNPLLAQSAAGPRQLRASLSTAARSTPSVVLARSSVVVATSAAAAFYPSAKMSTAGVYGKIFPAHRTKGVARVTVGPSAPAPAAERTIVHFRPKPDASAAAAPASLADKDLARDAVTVRYETVDGKEVRVVIASVAPASKVDASGLKGATAAVVARLRALKVTSAEFVVPALPGAPAAKVAAAIAQAAALSNYHFDRYLTTEDKVPVFLESIHLTTSSSSSSAEEAAEVEKAVTWAATLADCTTFARDLVNERADEMAPDALEAAAAGVAAETGATLTVVKGEDLVAHGLHLMAAVGQAARHGPRYVELVYKGDPETYKTDGTGDVTMVVGKGITFDTGGLNLKGTGFMEDMYMDMGGAAASLGACLAVHRLGIKRNVVFIAAVAENAMDSASYKPHSIIRSHKGLTVQIGNTDAEGRLVLADALSFGQSRCRPHTVLDMATLTGACIVALGEYAAGLFSNNGALRQGLQAAADASSERLWALPIFPEHREELRAVAGQADLSSTGAGRYGGACTAAAFLENFIGHEPAKNARNASAAPADPAAPAPFTPAWAHLDIAGPASYSKPRGMMPAGGTGFGVAVVAHYLAAAPKGKLPADEVKRF